MKKIADMDDDEIIQKCHWFYEENNLAAEWRDFRKKAESEYRFCSYLEEYIEEGLCYDLQLIAENCTKASALHEINVDTEKCAKCCYECKYSL